MEWQQFVMNLDTLDPAIVEEIFTRHNAWSVTLSDAGNSPVLEPGPGETPLWAETRITGLFSADADLGKLEAELLQELQLTHLPPYRIDKLADRAWEREWLTGFGPMKFGERLWICPGTSEVEQQDAVIVRLDPGLAFGTGTHATTALCLEWLDGLSLGGKMLLDYGCGSGVLAIAAIRLGCRETAAMDIDPQALIATAQNAERNAVAGRVRVYGSEADIEGVFDVVVANILAGPLVQFAESITSTLAGDGMLALSGVLCEQAASVMAAYEPWIEFDETVCREQDGQTWSRLTGTRR
ncbi:MAG: 50S ribosomal protein L11 methyltransferase [Gammaproteobacteria bacterium]|nr:50S ribosomal protein L11 methyltransferase [Gammaproteobacteria bacterium]MDH3363436.1 50S ribosomal protein L11 methyltransferase [Gammaproteobacteria bacterium]MDH3482186.1 50S ribosomal protein L11 methyltransferase [Gammaproteobacteria bacterium]